MIQIAICDDCAEDRKALRQMLKDSFAKKELALAVEEYASGTVLADDYIEGTAKHALIFLDIFMQDCHGIPIAKTIRECDPHVKIVFFTTSKDYALESYEVSAFQYLVKPVCRDKVDRIVDQFTSELENARKQSLFLKKKSQPELIPYGDIVYMESQNSCVLVHTKDGSVHKLYAKLSALEKELDGTFFVRCHQSFLVNLSYVRSVKKEFLLENGISIPIRRQDAKRMRERFYTYVISASD